MAAPPFNPSNLDPPDLDLKVDSDRSPVNSSFGDPESPAPSNSISAAEPQVPFSRPRVAYVPDLAHTVIFFLLAVAVLFVGELFTVTIGRSLPLFRHEDLTALSSDPRLMIPAQAMQYTVLLGLTTLIFGAIWHQPFWKGIRWNGSVAARHWIGLGVVGLILGFGSSLATNFLPMPKEAPILNDLMNSTAGAWMMFAFATTGAPLIEELAFRGFLLPALINAFRWLDRRRSDQEERHPGSVPSGSTLLLGVPLSILLTSLPFALLHSFQVSHAWAPVLLIGMVSIALCFIRLLTNSLAASTLVHAAYNFSLFAGMMIASDGFRHLEKLNN